MMKHPGRFIVTLLLATLAPPAMAHPGHPLTGFTSGLLHPLTGLDHLLVMLSAGLLIGRYRPQALPGAAAFASAFAIGLVAATGNATAPGSLEGALAGSVLISGLLLCRSGESGGGPLVLTLALLAGLHGYAHGTEAPLARLLPWGTGAVAIVFTVTAGAGLAGRRLRGHHRLLNGMGLGVTALAAWMITG